MNKKQIIKWALGLGCILSFAGCVGETPGTVSTFTSPTTGLTGTVTNPPLYAVSPQLVNTLSNLQAEAATAGAVVSTVYPPAAPFVPLGQMLLGAVGAIITTVSAGIAYVKNQSAATHAAAANTLAEAVVNTPGAALMASQLAVKRGTSAAVATHLANNTRT
jgi:trehalose-6-phosphatase